MGIGKLVIPLLPSPSPPSPARSTGCASRPCRGCATTSRAPSRTWAGPSPTWPRRRSTCCSSSRPAWPSCRRGGGGGGGEGRGRQACSHWLLLPAPPWQDFAAPEAREVRTAYVATVGQYLSDLFRIYIADLSKHLVAPHHGHGSGGASSSPSPPVTLGPPHGPSPAPPCSRRAGRRLGICCRRRRVARLHRRRKRAAPPRRGGRWGPPAACWGPAGPLRIRGPSRPRPGRARRRAAARVARRAGGARAPGLRGGAGGGRWGGRRALVAAPLTAFPSVLRRLSRRPSARSSGAACSATSWTSRRCVGRWEGREGKAAQQST